MNHTQQIEPAELLSWDLETLLSQSKSEWLENAPETYGSDAINIWRDEIVPRLMSWKLRDIDREDLDLYCPSLRQFLNGPG